MKKHRLSSQAAASGLTGPETKPSPGAIFFHISGFLYSAAWLLSVILCFIHNPWRRDPTEGLVAVPYLLIGALWVLVVFALFFRLRRGRAIGALGAARVFLAIPFSVGIGLLSYAAMMLSGFRWGGGGRTLDITWMATISALMILAEIILFIGGMVYAARRSKNR